MAKKQSYVGIDLGGSSIKIVELQLEQNRPQLVTYGFIDETYNIVKDDTKEARAAIAEHLRELLKRAKVSTENAVAALPSFSVFSSIISLPAMNKKDLISAVRWEAKKFVPIPLEEMILDWEVLGGMPGDDGKQEDKKRKKEKEINTAGLNVPNTNPTDKGASAKDTVDKRSIIGGDSKPNLKVLLTAAPKNLVNNYVALFKDVGLRLVGLETESFAIERSLVGNDHNPIMVIDIGGGATSIIIYADGVPILNRSIDLGGKSITQAIVDSMQVSYEQAEQMKRDLTISMANQPLDQLPKQVKYVINAIMNEIRYITNIYRNQNKQPISKVVLTGGSAFLGNITQYIQESFNIRSFVGDPWARVVHPVEIDSLLRELGPRMSVAIGLAMRELQ
ncbi:MAG: pilus assembly protein PilM [Candidatus Kerfeldbacteria bacterium]|nr:pilus assembly protein PilM [Candidatus Kerfeldbacteria bacterium]